MELCIHGRLTTFLGVGRITLGCCISHAKVAPFRRKQEAGIAACGAGAGSRLVIGSRRKSLRCFLFRAEFAPPMNSSGARSVEKKAVHAEASGSFAIHSRWDGFAEAWRKHGSQ